MIWLTWRQFRAQATAVYAAVLVAAVTLAITGPRLVRLASSEGNLFDRLTDTDRNLFYGGVVVLALAPAIIGIFWGAPLVARELEHGTHRLAWTQSVTRTRWLATKLGVTAVGTVVALGVLTLAVTWWSHPIDGAMSSTRGGLPSRLTLFAMRGIVPIGYAVFAVVLGATLGIMLRRSLPAMAITLTVYLLMQIGVPFIVRPYLVDAVHESVTISSGRMDSIEADETGRPVSIEVNTGHQGDWVLSNDTVNAKGQVTALPAWFADCLAAPASPGDAKAPVPANNSRETCFTRLISEGYQQRLVYQPANHFWPLQWAETGGYLALSALMATLCFWWTRRRLS